MTPARHAPAHVVLTGQVRDPARLRRSVDSLVPLRDRGLVADVVLSTWPGEVEAHAGLLDGLDRLGVTLVTPPPPAVDGRGNVWRQMVSLSAGLAAVPADAWVLKSRPDVYINPAFIERLATGGLDLDLPAGARSAGFAARVWVPWFEITKPTYLGDECFFGHARDVRRLVNFDASFDAPDRIGVGITHVRRFLPAVARAFPMLARYVAAGARTGLGRPPRADTLAALLRDPFYLRALAEYYVALHALFRVRSAAAPGAPAPIEFRGWSGGSPSVDPERFAFNFLDGSRVGHPGGHVFCHDDGWLDRLLSGRIAPDDHLPAFRAALEDARAGRPVPHGAEDRYCDLLARLPTDLG